MASAHRTPGIKLAPKADVLCPNTKFLPIVGADVPNTGINADALKASVNADALKASVNATSKARVADTDASKLDAIPPIVARFC
jgi:hypothetical protein